MSQNGLLIPHFQHASSHLLRSVFWGSLLVLFSQSRLSADHITFVTSDGKTVGVEARVVGSGQNVVALELEDGQWQLVPEAAIVKREEAPDPEPLDAAAVIERLTDEFGADTFRAYAQAHYVVGLVLSAPLSKAEEVRARASLKKGARFLQNVESVFERFAKSARLPLKPPRYPLVVLIFETDERFNACNQQATGGRGISASNTAGFYSGISNRLAIRMSECLTFQTPLHEAIHQQVYNRQVFQRLAPVPAWFNEGLATGFEGNGERINIGPTKISVRYARIARSAHAMDWATVVANDLAFQGDMFAGEAYAHAWSLHWLLVTKHKAEYAKYVKCLAKKKPLETDDTDHRISELEETIGESLSDLQSEFRRALEVGLRHQRLPQTRNSAPGLLVIQSNLAEVGMSAIVRGDRAGAMQVGGKLRNLSTIRTMSFLVVVLTNAGTYAEWYIPDVDVNQTVLLKRQFAVKRILNGSGGPATTFRVQVLSAIPDSKQDKQWQHGEFSVPMQKQ